MDIIKNIYNYKLLKDSIYFKITFMLWALIHSLGSGGHITGYFSPIFIIWGLLLLAKNLISKDMLIKKRYIYLIITFLLLYVITIFYNRQFNFVGNVKSLIWTSIMLLVIFINEYTADREKVFNDIRKISIALTISICILSLIALIMFCFDVSYQVNRGDGKLIPQGFWAARLWGIYVDPNQGATIAMMSILASIILLLRKNKNLKIINIISVMNIIIQYIFIILTGSRGGEIAFIFVLTGLIYLFADYILRNKLRNKYVRKIFVAIMGGIIAFFIIGTFDDTRVILGKVPSLTMQSQKIISNKLGVDIGKHEGNITMVRPDVGEGKEVSNGRLTLWKDGFRLIKHSPIFGFGDRNIFLKAKELTPGSSLEKQYVHNGFIHMVLSGGIVAGITMLLLLFFAIIDIVKIVFTSNIYTSKYYIYSCIGLIVGASLITAIFLTELFYQNSFISTVFWIYLGFMVSIDKKELIG